MALNFPTSPANGQIYTDTATGAKYIYYSPFTYWKYYSTSTLESLLSTQIVFDDNNIANGSNGMTFSKTANTAYFNNVAVTQNVSATYFFGNGSSLTGVASDLTAANNWANTKVSVVSSNSNARIWANSATVSGIETVYIDLANSGVTATTYGGSTSIPVIVIDSYGRITSASNVTVQGMDYAYANTIGAASNTWANTVGAAANTWANNKVDTITSNSTTRIWANSATVSGIETVYIDLANSGVTATTYGGSETITPAITVDSYGRITSASNITVTSAITVGAASNTWANTVGASANGYTNTSTGASNTWANTVGASANGYTNTVTTSDRAYTNTSTTAANNYAGVMANAANTLANSKVDTITSNSTTRIWANSSLVSNIETVYLDLANSGVTATTYGGSTSIPAITVDAYGRITSASNVSVSSGGLTVNNETSSTSTYYPVFTTNTTGSISIANTSSTKLYFVPSTGTLSATIFNSLSDQSLKTDIGELDGIELLNKVNPISFRWKDTGVRSYGVIAQELEKVLPELVETNDQGLKSVSYIPIIAMLIDVVKKQDKEIEKIQKLLNSKK